MNQKLFQLRSFITYWLDAVDVHSLHSPFFYDLYTQVICGPHVHDAVDAIEKLRHELLSSSEILQVVDLGAGSQHSKTTFRAVSDIARSSLSTPKHSILYRNLIHHVHAKEIIELGTSLGINTLYMASGNPHANVKTLEGSVAIAAIAQAQFDRSGFQNIVLVTGNIDETINGVVDKVAKLDIAFIDANHRYDPTLHYFETLLSKTHSKSIIILDDIHYSDEMERAWKVIRSHQKVYATADLYRCGLVFFDPSLAKQHFVLLF